MAEYWPMVLSMRMPEMPTTNLYMKKGMRKTKRQKAQTTKRQKLKMTNMQMK